LIAIAYPDENTAEQAAAEALKLAEDLVIQADAIAVITRDREGKFHAHTTHDTVKTGAVWGMFWGFLFGVLFFIPILGMAFGAGLGALNGLIAEKAVSKQFQRQIRDMLQPGTSALFMVLEKMTVDRTVEALSKYGGTVIKSSLSADVEAEIQNALHGTPAHV
jgi:uncharacterized membrane protein